LIALKDQSNCDFGKHIIPWLKERGDRMAAYEFNGYWKDVGTLGSYWEANMELIDIIPEFNLYEEFWKIIHPARSLHRSIFQQMQKWINVSSETVPRFTVKYIIL